MKYISETWVRIIVSLFAGGLIRELIHISTGDPNRSMRTGGMMLFFYGFIVYCILTYFVKRSRKHI